MPCKVLQSWPRLVGNTGRLYFMEEINIYHRPGPFVYIVRDKDNTPLYVGGTENINAKSFKFDFEYSSITGYYYDFPDFWDEVDRKIVAENPRYNRKLHSSFTTKQIISYIRAIFIKNRMPFRKKEKVYILEYLSDCDKLEYNCEIYYSELDRNVLTENIMQEWNIQ